MNDISRTPGRLADLIEDALTHGPDSRLNELIAQGLPTILDALRVVHPAQRVADEIGCEEAPLSCMDFGPRCPTCELRAALGEWGSFEKGSTGAVPGQPRPGSFG